MATFAYAEPDRDFGLFVDGSGRAVDRPWLEVYDKYRQRRLGRMAVTTTEGIERAVCRQRFYSNPSISWNATAKWSRT